MKRILAITALLIAAASPLTFGQTAQSQSAQTNSPERQSSSASEQEVRRVGQEYDRAWFQQDAAAFERLLADDFTQIDHEGKLFSKAEIVANAKSGDVKFEVGQSEDLKVRVYGNTAVVTGRWTEKSTNKGKPVVGTMLNTVVYVKKNGNWQVVSDQVTPIRR